MEQEALSLRARFTKVNRAAFARDHDLKGGQALIYQHITGRRPISLEAALVYAKAFGCALEDISPRLAKEAIDAVKQTGLQHRDAASIESKTDGVPDRRAAGSGDRREKSLSSVNAVHPDDPQDSDMVYVPESRIEFAAGNGRTAMYELIEDQEPASYRLSWFQKHGINPARVRRFRICGDSMEPLLYARDTILVNTDETNIIDGKLYAIRYGDELRVKYLFRRLNGTLTLRSVNQQYKDEEVSPELAQEHIAIIGRVRDRSGTGGL